MLKKFFLIVAILLSIVISCGKIAYADAYAQTSEWARIVTDDVYLYASADTKQKLFVLEKSYYVNIIEETDTMYQVAVMPAGSADFVQVIGWVRQNDVSLSTANPVEPTYPTVKLTVNAESVDLKLSPVPSSATSCAILNLQQVCYYGSIINYGKTWYYVRYAGRFGYVDADAVTAPNISLHPTPLPQTPPNKPTITYPSDTTNPAPENNSPASEILLIVFVVVLAVGLTLALFLPGNIKKKNNVFEQDI